MRKLSPSLRRLLDRAQKRFQSARPGSVMILVVTLLVLMALIGTAFITTARSERYSVQLHSANTQIDLLVDGVKEMLGSRIAQQGFLDPYNNNSKRWNDVHSDSWLASRVPVTMAEAC